MKIAIVGYGLEGESNYRYYSCNPENEITIVDERQPEREIPGGVSTIIGPAALEELTGFDLVVRTAGWSPNKIKTNAKVWSATNEFFASCPAQIIGVTGTKGKGTTASLIASILQAAGKKVWLIGNIGKPSLDILGEISKDDIVVYELSSFQLWDLEYSPHIAVILLIESDHQDVHASFDEYVDAKSNITKYQTNNDLLVYNQENYFSRLIAETSTARLMGYPDVNTTHIRDGSFYFGEQVICSVNELKLVGRYHQENACAAINAVWNITNDPVVIKTGLSNFTGLPHRLQFVREVDGVKYYDDSIATTPSSAIADIRSFTEPKIIILGGSSKGADYRELANELTEHSITALLIGDEAARIETALKKVDFRDYEIIDNPTMEQVVQRAHNLATKGDVVLLSPAAASFGLFKNYADRGDQFINAVNNLDK